MHIYNTNNNNHDRDHEHTYHYCWGRRPPPRLSSQRPRETYNCLKMWGGWVLFFVGFLFFSRLFQNVTGILQNSPDFHRNFARISNWSTFGKGQLGSALKGSLQQVCYLSCGRPPVSDSGRFSRESGQVFCVLFNVFLLLFFRCFMIIIYLSYLCWFLLVESLDKS